MSPRGAVQEAVASNPFRPEVVETAGTDDEELLGLDDAVLGPSGQARGPVIPPNAPRRSNGSALRVAGRLGSSQIAVVGLHGGAGATTAQRVLERYAPEASGLVWVAADATGSAPERGAVIVVARTSGVGLERAAQAAWQWGAGEMPGVALLGLLLVADGPKLARELAAPLKRVSRMYPRTWRLEWVPEWHLSAEPPLDRVPRRVAGVAKKTSKWATERGLEPNPKEQSL